MVVVMPRVTASRIAQSPITLVPSLGAVGPVVCALLLLFSTDGRFLRSWCRASLPVEVIFIAMIRIGDPIPVPEPLDVVI